MYCRLNKYLSTNNILATEQYGLGRIVQKNRQLTHLLMVYFQAWNSKSQVVGIFCDLAKAFDCVNRDTLIV
jgi:hypothetical protein